MTIDIKSPLLIATILALISHALLLLFKVSFTHPEMPQDLAITVRLREELIEPLEQIPETELQKQNKETEKKELKDQASQPAKRVPPISSTEVIIKTAEPTEDTNTTITPIRLSDFKNAIIQDAKNHFSNNPDQLDALDKTFEFKSNKQAPVSAQSKEAQQQLRQQNGGRTIDANGKHTCFDHIHDLSSAQTGSYTVFSDCTPEKKFELDIDAPNNG